MIPEEKVAIMREMSGRNGKALDKLDQRRTLLKKRLRHQD